MLPLSGVRAGLDTRRPNCSPVLDSDASPRPPGSSVSESAFPRRVLSAEEGFEEVGYSRSRPQGCRQARLLSCRADLPLAQDASVIGRSSTRQGRGAGYPLLSGLGGRQVRVSEAGAGVVWRLGLQAGRRAPGELDHVSETPNGIKVRAPTRRDHKGCTNRRMRATCLRRLTTVISGRRDAAGSNLTTVISGRFGGR